MSYVFPKRPAPEAAPRTRLRDLYRKGLTVDGSRPGRSEPWSDAKRLAVGAGAVAFLAWLLSDDETPRAAHDREVERLAMRELEAGRMVAADLPGWPRPPTMDGARGDVYSVSRGGVERVIEVEHLHTLTKGHTVEQLTKLSRWAGRSDRRSVSVGVTGYRKRGPR